MQVALHGSGIGLLPGITLKTEVLVHSQGTIARIEINNDGDFDHICPRERFESERTDLNPLRTMVVCWEKNFDLDSKLS